MKLSIIIPVYNVEKHISRCLDSLVNQDIDSSEYEVIIVSDGSKDNSIAIAESYCKQYNNFFIHHQENQGVGAARNKGMSLAKGDYIYFLDPDDYIADNVLKNLTDFAITYQPDVLTFKSKGTTLKTLNAPDSSIQKPIAINKKSGLDYIAQHNFKSEIWWYIINKKFIDDIKLEFIVGRWMEDAIFTAKLFVKAKNIIKLPFDIHRHVKVYGSAMTNKAPSHYLKIINDNANAAVVYNDIIESLENDASASDRVVKRLRTRQQSFVFFMMVRILKSTFKKQDIIPLLNKMKTVNAYKLNAFIGESYNGLKYSTMCKLFNNKYLYYLIFLMLNPVLKRQK